jgi:hypothetical protein
MKHPVMPVLRTILVPIFTIIVLSVILVLTALMFLTWFIFDHKAVINAVDDNATRYYDGDINWKSTLTDLDFYESTLGIGPTQGG